MGRNGGDGAGGHAQLVDTQPDQERDHLQIRRGLAADRDVTPPGARRIDHGADEPQHGRLERAWRARPAPG